MAVYRQAPMERYLTPFIFTLFAVVAVVLLVAMVRGDGPPAWFGVLWLAALGWNAYWWLLRICTEVEVDSDTLR